MDYSKATQDSITVLYPRGYNVGYKENNITLWNNDSVIDCHPNKMTVTNYSGTTTVTPRIFSIGTCMTDNYKIEYKAEGGKVEYKIEERDDVKARSITTTNGRITVTVYGDKEASLDELKVGNIIGVSRFLYGSEDITISENYIETCASEATCDTPPAYIEAKYQILPTDTIERVIETYSWYLAYVWENDRLMVTMKPLESAYE